MSKRIKVIKANTIILEDSNGKPRIHLDAADLADFPRITLFAPNGASIAFVANEGGCSISINHPGGNTAACIGVKSDGQSGLELRDAEGKPSICLESKGPMRAAKISILPLKAKKTKGVPNKHISNGIGRGMLH